jgi:hypothetical protein
MNEPEWVERFNRDLDRLLLGPAAPDLGDAPQDYRQALELARRLQTVDFSAASSKQALLQQRLMPRAEAQLRKRARWNAVRERMQGASQALVWTALAVFLVTILSWTIRNLLPTQIPARAEPLLVEAGTVHRTEYSQFRSDRRHLGVALPPGWAVVEGEQLVDTRFVGLVAFNSWGEAGYWAGPVERQEGMGVVAEYSPELVLGQIPANGAYIVLGYFGGELSEETYGPEHAQQGLDEAWIGTDCRESGDPAGFTAAGFFKWGRRLRLEVVCGPEASDETARAVGALLESWRFDPVPAGDSGWATVTARQLLPGATDPSAFPIIAAELAAGETDRRSVQQETIVRTTLVEALEGKVVSVIFNYRWSAPAAGPLAQDCPPENCRWWRFEARPDGEVVLTAEGGAPLPGAPQPQSAPEAGEAPAAPAAQTVPPIVEDSPVGPLNLASSPEEIRARLDESWELWDTLWVDAQVTTSYEGETEIVREQVWVDQPDYSLWLSGPFDGEPALVRTVADGKGVLHDLAERSYQEFDRPRLVPSLLYKVVFPSWSIGLRAGDFLAVQEDEVAGRKTLVVDYTNIEGRRSDRFWIDASTGVILHWVHFPARSTGSNGREVFLEVLVTDLAYDVAFPGGLFDLSAAPPQAFADDYQLKNRNDP